MDSKINNELRQGFADVMNDANAPETMRALCRDILRENAKLCGHIDTASPEFEAYYYARVKPDPDAPARLHAIWEAAHPGKSTATM